MSLGAYGERVTRPDHIRAALQKAIEVANTGQPALLEMISKEEVNISTYGR
jgi:thiamine pyrophosphate-dependent acetolactate synthase large subunit-like protein